MKPSGPKTRTGKAISAQNATQHGIYSLTPVIPTQEQAEEWERCRVGIETSLAPVGPLETILAQRVALLLWRLRRVARYEAAEIMIQQEALTTDGTAAKRLAQAEQNQAYVQGELEFMEALPTLADVEPVSGYQAVPLLCKILGEEEDLDEKSLPLPKAYQATGKAEGYPGWTAGLVRQCLHALGKRRHVDPVAFLKEAAADCRKRLERIKTRRSAAERALEHRSLQKLLPDAEPLEKVMRYEAHLSRQLWATMHELEALQARRQGQPTPLARLEVQSGES